MYYLSIDLEMTGLEPGWHEIIQLGAVLYDENWRERGDFLTNIYPENEESYSLWAEEVHQLSLADLDDAPQLYEALEEFEKWLKKTANIRNLDGFRQIHICGQSVSTDLAFMKAAYRQEKMKWPFANNAVDLYNLTYALFPVLARCGVKVPAKRSLGAVAEWLGLSRESEVHNALEDARLTGQCLQAMFDYLDKMELKK